MVVESGESSSAMKWAGGVSAVWLLVWAAVIFLGSHGCDEGASNLWQSHVACLQPNEIGDTLGGGFAPLALVWLMTAVVLQSRELRAQREELTLTREEMRESRGVLAAQKEAMDAQVAEARRNVELVSGQLEAQNAAYARSEQIEAARIVDDLISAAAGIITQAHPTFRLAFQLGGDTKWSWGPDGSSKQAPFATVKSFNELLLREHTLVTQIHENMPNVREGDHRLQELAMIYDMIIAVRQQTGSSKHMQVGVLKVEETLAQLARIMDALGLQH